MNEEKRLVWIDFDVAAPFDSMGPEEKECWEPYSIEFGVGRKTLPLVLLLEKSKYQTLES